MTSLTSELLPVQVCAEWEEGPTHFDGNAAQPAGRSRQEIDL